VITPFTVAPPVTISVKVAELIVAGSIASLKVASDGLVDGHARGQIIRVSNDDRWLGGAASVKNVHA